MYRSNIRGKISVRFEHNRARGERGAPKTLGDCGTQKPVILHRLIGEPEEDEKYERGKDSGPPSEFVCIEGNLVLVRPGHLDDAREFGVGVSP